MSKVYLVNFATPNFYESQAYLNKNALEFGVDKTISFTLEGIKDTDFYKKNEALLQRKRWIGWGCWKPYVILEALKQIEDGDILVYCDSGIAFLSNIGVLVERCKKKGILLVESTGIAHQWTKRDCFVLMNCDKEEYHNARQVMGGLNLWKKTPESMKIVSEWLEFCKDPRIITDDPNTCGLPNFPDYTGHMGDQSILSLLAVKYKKNIEKIDEHEYSHFNPVTKKRDSSLWTVHRRRKRNFKEWIIWKAKVLTPVGLKDRMKRVINNYFKK